MLRSIVRRMKIPHLVQAEATYVGFVVVLTLPIANVQKMLPKQMRLATQTVSPIGEHPVMFMLGEVINFHIEPTETFFKGDYPQMLVNFIDLNYMQTVVSIPFVQWAKGDEQQYSFSFVPRLFINKQLPKVAGQLYGFSMQDASIGLDGSTYLVNRVATNLPILSGEFKLKGYTRPLSYFPLMSQQIPKLFQTRYVGKMAVGGFSRSTFDWHLSDAEVQAATATLHIADTFLPGLTTGSHQRSSIEVDPLGAFQVQLKWSLSPPMPTSPRLHL